MEYFFIHHVRHNGQLDVASYKNGKTRLLLANPLVNNNVLSVIADEKGPIEEEQYCIEKILPSNFFITPFGNGIHPFVIDSTNPKDEYGIHTILFDMPEVMKNFNRQVDILQEKRVIGVNRK